MLVVARESPDFANRRALVVRRSPAALATKVPAAQEDQGGPSEVADSLTPQGLPLASTS